MTTELIYQRLLEKVNKNISDGSIALDKARAVTIFNEEMYKYVYNTLKKRGTSEVLDVQVLLTNVGLDKAEVSPKYTKFKLPDDYFSFVNTEVVCRKGSCSDSVLTTEIKPEDVSVYLNDVNLKPSFKAREVLYILENSTIKIFKDTDFDIEEVFLNYYRYPKKYNISGYIDENNQKSFDSMPELDERVIDKILNMSTLSFDKNEGYSDRFQLDLLGNSQK